VSQRSRAPEVIFILFAARNSARVAERPPPGAGRGAGAHGKAAKPESPSQLSGS
jgi:hypothetical protein